ncbi:MAG: NAD(+)/NADH kinase [Phycisphaerales bacterium]|nr:NAD(+)/NADH kinase [Phycisphaerales bacterium]
MRVLLVHNPKAGYEQADGPEILRLIGDAGHEAVYQSTEVDDFAAHFEERWDAVVVAGGDGTVTRVMKLCADRPAAMAVLPVGTANNVATAIGHTGALEDLINAWDPQSRRPVDMGMAIGDWGRSRFAESFGVGLMAETIVMADKGNEEKARAKFKTVAERLEAGIKVLRRRLKDLKPAKISLRAPDGTHEGKFLWAEVSTVGLVGPRMPILENDDPGDGLLAYALLPVEERETLDTYLEHRQLGSAPRRTGLITGRAERLTITWSGCEGHIDGRLLPGPAEKPGEKPGQRTAELEIQPGAVQVLRLSR